MNRRDVLFLSSAAVTVLASNRAAEAMPLYQIPDADSELVNRAVDAAEYMGFRVAETVKLFGLNAHTLLSFTTLREHAARNCGSDIRTRALHIISIRESLDERFPGNKTGLLAWMCWPHPMFSLRSLRDKMLTGHQWDLQHAAGVIRSLPSY